MTEVSCAQILIKQYEKIGRNRLSVKIISENSLTYAHLRILDLIKFSNECFEKFKISENL